MKKFLILFILVLDPYIIISETNSYDYSSYSATSTNQNLSGATITSSTSGTSAVYITSSGITITNSDISKSGDYSGSTEDTEFYGVNAAVLVQGGGLTITGGTISTSAKGGNGVVATNSGTVTISGTTITSTGSASARGLHSTYGGSITANSVTVSSTGGSCATLATDRGEGTVTCNSCTLTTNGSGSPLIYSTGEITVSGTTGTAYAAQAIVVEGKNSATIKSSSTLKCFASDNGRNDECGILIYQSMSGDADTGTSSFNCESSTIEILEDSSHYKTAPMFYITNTEANIALTGCTFTYGSGTFLKAEEGSWGTSGSNGGTVTLTLTNQDITGDIVVGSSSSLTIKLISSTIKGTINGDKTASTLSITLDSDSKITLTGNSYYTSLTNADSSGSNIITGSYTWSTYDDTGNSTDGNDSDNSDRNQGNSDNKNQDEKSDNSNQGNSDNKNQDNNSDEEEEDEDILPINTGFSNMINSKIVFSIILMLNIFI